MTETSTAHKPILIVEDDPDNQYLMQILMEELQQPFKIVSNGQEAVDIVKNNDFCLIFMDIRMPVMTGYEATAAIRAFNKDIPIIAVTAHAMEWVPAKCLAIGMNDYLSKPFTFDKIREYITKWAKT
jgi:CheY-like chemotaxis protein